MQQAATFVVTDMTDNDDPIEERFPQNDNPFHPELSEKSKK